MQTVLSQWSMESDPVLADLCARFLNRRLFKYVMLEKIDVQLIEKLKAAMHHAGWNPAFYAEIDFPSDLSYDVYRPGNHDEKLPILLQDQKGGLTEISRKSEIVRSISGIHMGKYHLYFPEELLQLDSSLLSPELRKLLRME